MAILTKFVNCQGYSSGGYYYKAEVKINSQSIENNTSNVTITFSMMDDSTSNSGFIDYNYANYGIYVDNACKKSGDSANTTIYEESSYQTIGSWTGDVAHDADGSKTISVGLTFKCGTVYHTNGYLPKQNDGSSSYPSGTPYIWSMGNVTLSAIPRMSIMTISGTKMLNSAQMIAVERKVDTFTHTITWNCGTASGSICNKSSSVNLTFIPSLDLAAQNTTGTNVSISYTITTYNGDVIIGSKSITAIYAIPESVKPVLSLITSDPSGYLSTYGKYIQGNSGLKIVLTASGAYGSTVMSYKTTADGGTYTESTVNISKINGSGELTVSATVTDSRNRTATATKVISVYSYDLPKINSVKIYRSTSNGTEDRQGAYLAVSFDTDITSLDNKNAASYTVSYKKISEDNFTNATLTDYANVYTVIGGLYVFAADTSYSYDVIFTIADDFKDDDRVLIGPSIKTFMSWRKNSGLALNKTAELDNVFDVNFQTHLRAGLLYPEISKGEDLNDFKTPNFISGNADLGYLNSPISSGAFTLEVKVADGTVIQTLIPATSENGEYKRIYTTSWSEWSCCLPLKFGGTGKSTFTSGSYIVGNGTKNLDEKTSEEVANDIGQYIKTDVSNLVQKPTVLWKNAAPTERFSGQTVTLSESILNYTHYSILHNTSWYDQTQLVSTGIIPITNGTRLQTASDDTDVAGIYRWVNKPSGTSVTIGAAIDGASSSRNDKCVPAYIYGWHL